MQARIGLPVARLAPNASRLAAGASPETQLASCALSERLQQQRMVVALHHDQRIGARSLCATYQASRPRPADADALPLADRVEREADVRADALALGRHDRPGLARQVAVEEFAERPLADEADAGGILLGVVRQRALRARCGAPRSSSVRPAGTARATSCAWFSRCRK